WGEPLAQMAFELEDIAMLYAALTMWPGGIIAWLVVGLIAGALAGSVMRGGGFGIIGDIIVGLIGALVGGWIVSLFDTGVAGFWGSIFVAFLGACVCIAIARAVAPKRAI